MTILYAVFVFRFWDYPYQAFLLFFTYLPCDLMCCKALGNVENRPAPHSIGGLPVLREDNLTYRTSMDLSDIILLYPTSKYFVWWYTPKKEYFANRNLYFGQMIRSMKRRWVYIKHTHTHTHTHLVMGRTVSKILFHNTAKNYGLKYYYRSLIGSTDSCTLNLPLTFYFTIQINTCCHCFFN